MHFLHALRNDLSGYGFDRGSGEDMRKELRIAGFGGQGVITLGTIVAVAAGIHEDLEVAQTQSYGPEARGGACRSDVVISDEPIDYTKPLNLDLFIALSQSGLDRYWPEVKDGSTLVLIDKTLVTKVPDHHPPVLGIEATRIAEEEFKERVVANMLLLGFMGARLSWIRFEAFEKALEQQLNPKSLPASLTALKRGYELGKKTPQSA
jgi:2-oxoglutarate ferredoxin oxidoreductase subunit gamma